MQLVPDSVFELAQMQRLFEEEWNLVRVRSARVASGPALSFSPLMLTSGRVLRSHPELTRLHVSGSELTGDMRCLPHDLPFQSESMQLIVARHVVDVLHPDSGIEAELVRVLAPGGVLFVFGMNRWSPWRLWCMRQARRGLVPPRCRSAAQVRRTFASQHLTPAKLEFLGGAWPADTMSLRVAGERGQGGHWEGAWLLVAHKERPSMRPISMQPRRNRAVLGPSLAQAPSRRTSL